jgi:hypothetical protein
VPVYVGVAYHPWAHVSGYHPNRTLNAAEIEWLERVYTEMHVMPFPDTPRRAISSLHEDVFVNILQRANRNPSDYRIHYARYYVIAGTRGSRVVPRLVMAFAYTLRTAVDIKRELQISYIGVS